MLHIDAGGFANLRSSEGAVRARTIVEAYGMMDVAAINVSPREMGESAAVVGELRAKSSIPFLSANIVDEASGEPYFQPFVKLTVGPYSVGVVGVTARVRRFWTSSDGKRLIVTDPGAAAKPFVEALAKETDLVILLAHVQIRRLKSLLQGLPGVDLVIGADGFSSTQKERKIGNAVACYSGRQGKMLGVIRLQMDRDRSVASLRQELVSLRKSMPEDPDVAALVERAKEEIAERAETGVETATLLALVNREYLGFTACRSCHRQQYDAWKRAPHYRAFDSLIEDRKVRDAECLPCHTTGYFDGGFVDLSVTPRMVNVQCEACHGPGAKHAGSPDTVGMPLSADDVCRRCHDSLNSPNFTFDSYWSQIRH